MSFISQLHRRAGVARTSTLIAAGVPRAEIARAVAMAKAVRVKRGWVALPDADPMLILAARYSMTISCISNAKRLGLWVFKEEQSHLASRPDGRHFHDPRAPLWCNCRFPHAREKYSTTPLRWRTLGSSPISDSGWPGRACPSRCRFGYSGIASMHYSANDSSFKSMAPTMWGPNATPTSPMTPSFAFVATR